MGYAEGNTHGFTPEDAAKEEEEYIMENLLEVIYSNIKEASIREDIPLDVKQIKWCLQEHPMPVPCSNWYLDEFGNEVQDEIEEMCPGWYTTHEDDIACLCWMCGLNLTTTLDWVDGSPTYTLELPKSYEEYLNNIKEGTKFWKEELL